MVHLIVGYGEVGKGLAKVLMQIPLKYATTTNLKDKILIHDPSQGRTIVVRGGKIDVAHICIPYKNEKQFTKVVKQWLKFAPLVIVHSSVPVGTCDALGVVHSPICGVHPHLAEGIRTFVKYFGGEDADKAAKIFKKLGLKVHVFKDARTTEAMKLWSTTQYGRLIMLEKEIYEWCQKNNLNFDDVYTRSNKDYNEGYVKLGMPQVVRPYLKHVPGPIGGHCVLPNSKLLKVKI